MEQGTSTTAQFAFGLMGPDEKVRYFLGLKSQYIVGTGERGGFLRVHEMRLCLESEEEWG